jgi:ABC-type transport system involved in multi-copper enzyme maturation permease subunit
MTSPEAIYAFRWLIRDTFRQSLANRIFWLMLGVSCLVIVVCLSVSVEGGEPLRPEDDIELQPAHGQMSLGFGAFPIALFRDGEAAVHFLLLLLAEWVAGAGGVLLALLWTAGFIPSFLQPSAAMVLLAKPLPRWALLAGKFLGVLALVALQVTVFIGGTWLALGLRTGFWVSSYLLGIPVLLIHFAAFFSFSAFLAVLTRSTLACIIGSILFWFMCWGANYGRHFVVALPYLDAGTAPLPASFQALAGFAYWILPKPVDMGMILHRALNVGESFRTFPELEKVMEIGEVDVGMAVISSLAFSICMMGIAARQLAATDY